VLEQHDKNSERLLGQAKGLAPVGVKFSRTQVELEAFETDQPAGAIESLHGTPQHSRNLTISRGAREISISHLNARKSLQVNQILI
jgi:hypothetical protein